MFFIFLLIISTVAIAGAAAFFSVYGLAYTFSGVFWSVVAMGASLEAGKLIAASYLYRYWTKTHLLLKTYLILGILALMVLTSVGIFGYLSVGYQQDILPLKQKTEQVQLLEEEKVRVLQRKRQIDDLMAGSTTIGSVETAAGIDRNAVSALRETRRSRESLVKQYKTEQSDVTKRMAELDVQLLTLKQELIQVEAHIGPITYIAKAFELPTDNATMYLILIIIFAFDPMAVALTLAVNIALRIRQDEKRAAKERVEEFPIVRSVVDAPPLPADMSTILHNNLWELYSREGPGPTAVTEPTPPIVLELEPIEPTAPVVEVEPLPPIVLELEPIEAVTIPEAPTVRPAEEVGSARRSRPYTALWSGDHSDAKINELVNYYQHQTARINSGDALSNDEQWELDAVKSVLQKAGFSQYL